MQLKQNVYSRLTKSINWNLLDFFTQTFYWLLRCTNFHSLQCFLFSFRFFSLLTKETFFVHRAKIICIQRTMCFISVFISLHFIKVWKVFCLDFSLGFVIEKLSHISPFVWGLFVCVFYRSFLLVYYYLDKNVFTFLKRKTFGIKNFDFSFSVEKLFKRK